jgi:hypothetical protein
MRLRSLQEKKMAEGGISSIHSCKKRATDLHSWKFKDRFVKVIPSISRYGELHVKVNPSNASISAAHLRSNIIEPLLRKTCSSTGQVSFVYLLLVVHAF